jgi:hypothetical protein
MFANSLPGVGHLLMRVFCVDLVIVAVIATFVEKLQSDDVFVVGKQHTTD